MKGNKFKITGIEFDIYGGIIDIDIGSVTLKRNGREYIVDIIESEHYGDNNFASFKCKAEKATLEDFPDCKFDFLATDLIYPLDTCSIYIGGDHVGEVENMSIAFKVNDSITIVKDLTLEE